jgi:hypothetical protein
VLSFAYEAKVPFDFGQLSVTDGVVDSMVAVVSAYLENASIDSLANMIAKKTDVAEHPKVFHHVGLLVNEPPGPAGLLFI